MDFNGRLVELSKIAGAPAPVVSVYLNTRWVDEHQRDRVRVFLKNELRKARQGAGRVMVAVPTASERTVQDLLAEVDELVCLNVRGGWSFAVADAYLNWYDLTEGEVLDILSSLGPTKEP